MPKSQKSLAERKAELQEQLKEIEEIEKAQRDEKCRLIGAAVYTAMEKDEQVKRSITPILEEHVTGKKARSLLELSEQ